MSYLVCCGEGARFRRVPPVLQPPAFWLGWLLQGGSVVDFSLSEEQKALQEAARKFARGELVDVARELEANNTPVPD